MEGSPGEYEGTDRFTAEERREMEDGVSGGGGMKSIKTTLDGRRRKGSEEQEIIISLIITYDEVRT